MYLDKLSLYLQKKKKSACLCVFEFQNNINSTSLNSDFNFNQFLFAASFHIQVLENWKALSCRVKCFGNLVLINSLFELMEEVLSFKSISWFFFDFSSYDPIKLKVDITNV